MITYPPPAQHPHCQCWPNLMRAFYCMTGHMTECHYPQTCAEARCAHLARYDPPDDRDADDDDHAG